MSDRIGALDDQLSRVAELVSTSYVPDSPTHDLSHLARVAAMAARICHQEGGDLLVAVSAAWLHDLHRQAELERKQFFVAPDCMDARALEVLTEAEVPERIRGQILDAIHYTDTFSFSDRVKFVASPEARAVRDADCLDAIGAIGVARAFSFGGSRNIAMWHPSSFASDAQYDQSKRPSSTIQHFYDKLLKVESDLQTATAKEMAAARGKYLRQFVDQFMIEWSEDLGVFDEPWVQMGVK